MQKSTVITWIALLMLTIIVAVISNFFNNAAYIVIPVLIFSALKFIGVSFQFMELNKAHVFWKSLMIGFLTLFVSIILILI